MKDDMLLVIATNAPKNIDALMQIRGMKKDVASGKSSEEILDILSSVKPDNKILKEIKQEVYHSIPALVEIFKMLLKIISHKEGVVARLIAGDTDIQKLASYSDNDNPVLSGWRYEIYGKEALKIRNGEISIHYNPETKNIEFLKAK
jgi:ribonuclease D